MQVFPDTYATDGIRTEIAREAVSSYSQAVFSEAVTRRRSDIALAELSGHLAGFAQLDLHAGHELAPAEVQAELQRLYVEKRFTGGKVVTQ